jgi:uncharacterized integral membrane protein
MSTRHQYPTTERTRIPPKWIAALVALAIAITFIVQNREWVTVTLFVTRASGPLWVALACVLVIGVACGYLIAYRKRR